MSRKRIRVALAALLVLALAFASLAVAASRDHGNGEHERSNKSNTVAALLIGHNETPAVHTAGRGALSLTLNPDKTMSYTLSYSALGSAAVAAHVHIGQPNVAGGVAFFLCGGG